MATLQPKKKLNNLILALAGFACIGLVWFSMKFQSTCRNVMVTLPDSHTISATLAATPWQRTLGLSGRSSLPADRGMLFLFGKSGIYPFWMKDTLIPLDIIWLSDKTVVDIVTLPAQTKDEAPPFYTPTSNADSVLEINAGQAQNHGVTIGQRVIWNTNCNAL